MNTTSNLREQAIDDAVAEYLEAERLGRPIGTLAWLAKHSDVRDDLERFLGDRSLFARAAGPVEPPTMGLEESITGSALPNVRYFGDYELIEEIARGGMGVVYKARQVSLNRVVALKMILRGSLAAKEDVQRFRTEAEAAANLDHPNIVPIYEVGEHEGHQYFTMKYIDGCSLGERLRGDGPRDVRKLVGDVLVPVARAVQFAHQRGILHRDLKPGNLLIDADGTPYVADFGLARRLDSDSSMTRTGQVVGSPSYMSPEQARGEKVLTTSADVYSLGAMLYELLTGKPPFRGASVAETLKQVLDNDPSHPRSINAVADRDLSIITMKCLEKEPSRRYDSAAMLADELGRWLAGEPIRARPVNRFERGWRWTKRNPLPAGLATAFVLSLVGGTVGMAALYSQAVARRDDANNERSIAFARELSARRSWYAADISLAARAWDVGSTPRVRQLLEQHRPDSGQRDLRGFEWHYLWRVMHAAKETKQLGTGEEANWRLLANGRYAVRAIDKSGRIELWNVETAQRRELPGQFVLGDWPNKEAANRWTLVTGEITLAQQAAQATPGVLLTREGELCLRTIDLETGKEVVPVRKVAFTSQMALPAGGSPSGTTFATSADGQWLVETSVKTNVPGFSNMPDQQSVGLWDIAKMMSAPMFQIRTRFVDLARGLTKEFKAPGMCISVSDATATFSRMAISPDGASVAMIALDVPKTGAESILRQYSGDYTAGVKTAIFRFNATKGFTSTWPVRKGIAGAYALTFSPEGRELMIAENDHALQVLDAQSGQPTGELRGHTGAIRCCAFSPDGAFLATAGEDMTIRVWERKTFRTVGVFSGHLEIISGLAFTPDGSMLVSVDRRGTVKHWLRSSPPGPHRHAMPQSSITSTPAFMAFSGDGSEILVDRHDMRSVISRKEFGDSAAKPMVLIDSLTGRSVTTRKLPPGNMIALASRGSEQCAILTDNLDPTNPARLWSIATNSVRNVPPILGTYFYRRALSPDGRFIATISLHQGEQSVSVRPIDAIQARELFRRKENYFSSSFFDFSADGRRLLILSKELGYQTWDADTGDAGLSVPLKVVPVGLAGMSGDGRGIYFATEDRQICRCDVATGKVTVVSAGSSGQPVQVLASPDDQRLFVLSGVAGSPWSIVVWDIQSGRELITLPVLAPNVKSIVLSPDGTKLAADTPDAVIVWDATTR